MIDGLIGGRLYGTAEERTGKSGKAFVTAKVRAAGGDGETLFVNVITFSRTVADALLALEDGDSVALSGSLTPKVWTDKNGETRPALDMVAHVVLTAYHVKRKREAVAAKAAGTGPDTNGGGADDMDDVL
ncbi:single-stranded DNA-binding protein [Ralstonia solanacearum]|uniref:single-stranded DNA-binding protein n=1 Tax=Ralstonia solanacearum TaxID=305 RepID=UPI001141E8D9|nr:single-stranded DNA-binding protein [Ralstonia solanacearum]MBT1537715.1 single-stranded DNA-binding protein [Ralstonia solanacearum]